MSDTDGHAVTEISQIKKGDRISIAVTDGVIEAVADQHQEGRAIMAETEEKKEGKSIEETFGELDLLARKLEDKETPLEESFPPLQTGNGAS